MTESKDLEVLDGVTRCLARFATEVWPAYQKYCCLKETESIILALFSYKHQGIRSAAIQILIATDLQTESLKRSNVIWNHPSPKVHVSGVLAIAACYRAGITINLLLLLCLTYSSNHRKVINVVLNTLEAWLDKANIRSEKKEIKLACDKLSCIDNLRIKIDASIHSKLEILVAGQKPKATKYRI